MRFREFISGIDNSGTYVDVDDYRHRLGDYDAEKNALRAEVETLRNDLRVLQEVRDPGGCECSDDEACRFVRERDAVRAEVERLTREGLRASAGKCVEPDKLRGDDGGRQYCGLRAEVERLRAKVEHITRDRDRLLKDLQDIAKGCGVGVPDREEAKRIIVALCTAARRIKR